MRFCRLVLRGRVPDVNAFQGFREVKVCRDAGENVDIAIPVFGDKSDISVDRKRWIIRRRIAA